MTKLRRSETKIFISRQYFCKNSINRRISQKTNSIYVRYKRVIMQCTHENGKKQVAKLSSDNKFPFHFLQFDLENYTKFTFYFNWRIWRANCRSHFADRFRWNYLIVWVKMKPIRYMLLQTPFRYSNLNTFNVFFLFRNMKVSHMNYNLPNQHKK